MTKKIFSIFSLFCLLSIIVAQVGKSQSAWTESTKEDFEQGTLSNVQILSPDPTGSDNGALKLVANPTIKALQVYPDGHSTTVIRDAVYAYQGGGIPAIQFQIDLLPLSQFKTAQSIDTLFTVKDAKSGQTYSRTVSYYDVLIFGVADWYGAPDEGGDLAPASAEVVRQFAKEGKGIVFTHDTMETHPSSSSCYGSHPDFCALTDVSGIKCKCYPNNFQAFTGVTLISSDTSNPVLNIPFILPTSFPVQYTHWLGQEVVNGTIWYAGAGVSSPELYGLYMHTYYNPAFNSYSAFFSYGHTETVPAEFEAKAMINSMYYSYQGGAGNGYYVSKKYFAECTNVIWETPNWEIETPGNSMIKVQARTSVDGVSWNEWVDVQKNTKMNLPAGQFFQFKVIMTSDSAKNLPILHNISFRYSCATSACSSKPK
jgi:hypothetical protein